MIGILSDAHGNTEAFKLAIGYLRDLGANRFVFLGDAVGYIPSTGVLTELLKLGKSVVCILGNHEVMLMQRNNDIERDKIYKHQAIMKLISEEQLGFIEKWSTHYTEKYYKCSARYVHGGPNDVTNEYVYPDSDFSQYKVKESFIFMGHSHYPFVKKVGETTFVNVGSCGLPRDIGNLGSFAIFDPEKGEAIIYRFDMSSIIEKIIKCKIQVHESVLHLFKRSRPFFEGELL